MTGATIMIIIALALEIALFFSQRDGGEHCVIAASIVWFNKNTSRFPCSTTKQTSTCLNAVPHSMCIWVDILLKLTPRTTQSFFPTAMIIPIAFTVTTFDWMMRWWQVRRILSCLLSLSNERNSHISCCLKGMLVQRMVYYWIMYVLKRYSQEIIKWC